jgi:hypothetical protein
MKPAKHTTCSRVITVSLPGTPLHSDNPISVSGLPVIQELTGNLVRRYRPLRPLLFSVSVEDRRRIRFPRLVCTVFTVAQIWQRAGEPPSWLAHSYRKQIIGSTLAARRAGP